MRAIYLYDSLTNKSVSYMEENKLIDISRNQDYILQYDIDIKTLLFENWPSYILHGNLFHKIALLKVNNNLLI